MDGNPFYVEPGNNILPGLGMFNQSLQQYGQKKEMDAIKAGAVQAYQSGDPDVMAKYSLLHPEIAQLLTQEGNFRNQRTKENFLNSGYELLANPTLENARNVIQSRQALLRAEGVSPENSVQTDTFLQRFQANPQGTMKSLEMELAGMDPQRFLATREAMMGKPYPVTYSKTNPNGQVQSVTLQPNEQTPENINQLEKAGFQRGKLSGKANLTPGQIYENETAKKKADLASGGISSAQADEKYRQIRMAENQGKPVSANDQAWAKAYEQGKSFNTASYAKAYAAARLALPYPAWDTKQHKAVLVSAKTALSKPNEYKPMSSPEAKAAMPTSTVLTMQQTAPHVIWLDNQVQKDLQTVGKIGPITGRWRELWAGKVGTPDPRFTRLRTDTAFLMTLLMRMHVGARGSDTILDHFKNLINEGHQSPQNMQVAIDAIRDYANSIISPQYGWPGAPNPPAGAEVGADKRQQAIDELRKRGKEVNEQTIQQAMKLMGE